MLSGHSFWLFIENVIPIYVIVLLGLAAWKLKMIQPMHAAGIGRFLSVIAIPFYAFSLMAFNDPYQTSFKIVAADSLQKVISLTIGVLYWKLAKNGQVDHAIRFFMFATLPNIVVVGDPLLDPLYANTLGAADVHGKLVTLIFLQVLIWFNVVIAMFEMRIVLQEWQANTDAANVGVDLDWQKQYEKGKSQFNSTFSKSIDVTGDGGQGLEKDDKTSVDHSLSHASEELPSGAKGPSKEAEGEDQDTKGGTKIVVIVLNQAAPAGGRPKRNEQNTTVFCSLIASKVLMRFVRVPITCAILSGFAYSLFAYKWHWKMPIYVQTTVDNLGNGAIGMALFVLGLTWGASRNMMICSWKQITFGMCVRVVFSPLLMIATSLAVRLKGEEFRFSVLQAVISQSLLSFVLAKEYNVYAEEFAAATILQLVLCLPFIVIYYIVLEQI